MNELKIELIDSATQNVNFEITLELLEEMAHCINDCSWVSGEEIYTYMKSCVTGANNYEHEQWSVGGRGVETIDRDIIEHNRS